MAEFLLIMALLTTLGVFLMLRMVGTDGNEGAAKQMQQRVATNIANDRDD